jgi:hypothetical protein
MSHDNDNTQLTLSEVQGPLNQLNVNLTGPEGRRWLSALNRFLRREGAAWDVRNFDVWKSVKLGTYKNISELKKALMDSGFKLISDDRTNLLLDEMDFSEVATIIEADLILVSVKELGFKKGATSEEVLERARELGLELCPAEAAPQLQLQFPNQVENPYMYVRSKSGDLSCFHITNSMIFAALPTSLQDFWSASGYFVFVRLRK